MAAAAAAPDSMVRRVSSDMAFSLVRACSADPGLRSEPRFPFDPETSGGPGLANADSILARIGHDENRPPARAAGDRYFATAQMHRLARGAKITHRAAAAETARRANFEIGTAVMGISDLPANDATARTTSGRHLLLLLATVTAAIFVSAALLFMVQPMFTKMVLPRLGGAPSVWSVAIVFFQGALLAGYAYAHWLTRSAPGRASIVVHLVVSAAAVF